MLNGRNKSKVSDYNEEANENFMGKRVCLTSLQTMYSDNFRNLLIFPKNENLVSFFTFDKNLIRAEKN